MGSGLGAFVLQIRGRRATRTRQTGTQELPPALPLATIARLTVVAERSRLARALQGTGVACPV